VFGLYAGLVYLTPLFGGLLADRLLGRTKTIVLGACLMALGHFLMAFEASLPLALPVCCGRRLLQGQHRGAGRRALRAGDTRRASAFQIFMLAVQIAVILAPIVCGTLGEKVAWHWGFGAAGVGMLIGLGCTSPAGAGCRPSPHAAARQGRHGAPRMTAPRSRAWCC
jgi:POT family proton-dependent oligopeptide transporter